MLPDNHEFHLWHLHQSDFELQGLGPFEDWLTAEELARYRRFQFDRHKRQLLLGRILLRSVLSRYYPELPPAQWQFNYNEQGKPSLAPGQAAQPLYFNLSHSRDRILLAVSAHRDIGVDIEYCQRQRKVDRLVQRFFSGIEGKDLLLLPEQERLKRFYQLWTLKESYIKALGLGLALPLDSFSFGFPEAGSIRFTLHEDEAAPRQERWLFWQLDCGHDYAAAMAVHPEQEILAPGISGWRMTSPGEFAEASVGVRASNQS